MSDLKGYTPIYSFPYPLSGDSVANTYLRIQELAERIESTYTILDINLSGATKLMQQGDAAGGDLSGTYPNPSIATGAVVTAKIADSNVTTGKIANSAVTTAKIADAAVTSEKLAVVSLADGSTAITQAQSDGSTKVATTAYVDAYITGTIPDGSISTAELADGAVTNAKVSATAAIAYSKLNLLASIVNADIASSAAIAYSKLALAGSIVNADIATGASIAYSKLNLTGSVLEADLAFSIATQAELDTHTGASTSVHGITNTANLVYTSDSRLTDARTPTGGAGGVLSGTYPNPGFAVDMATQSELDTHASDTTSVHGIADTSVLATATDVSTAVSTHSSDTTSVHGIADTSALATSTDVSTAVSTHSSDTTSVHGIADTSVLATATDVSTAVSTHSSDTTSVHGISNTADLVLTGDARLSDARTPTSHAGTHVPGGSDVLDYTKIIGYGTSLPTWSATTHPAGVLWVVNTVGEPYSLYRSDGVSAWKQVGGGGASVTASDTAPSSPTSGALWFDSTTGKTFIWYVDGSSNQWVEVGEASQLSVPTHGSSHVRGGSDIIDGDRLTIDYVPTYYTRNAAASGAGDVSDLTANLSGIDNKFAQIRRLGYVTNTSTYSLTSSTVSGAANIFSSSITWTAVGSTAYRIEFFCPYGYTPTDVDTFVTVVLVDGSGNDLGKIGVVGPTQVSGKRAYGTINGTYYYTPSVGTTTINARAYFTSSNGNGSALVGNTGGVGVQVPMFLSVYGPEIS